MSYNRSYGNQPVNQQNSGYVDNSGYNQPGNRGGRGRGNVNNRGGRGGNRGGRGRGNVNNRGGRGGNRGGRGRGNVNNRGNRGGNNSRGKNNNNVPIPPPKSNRLTKVSTHLNTFFKGKRSSQFNNENNKINKEEEPELKQQPSQLPAYHGPSNMNNVSYFDFFMDEIKKPTIDKSILSNCISNFSGRDAKDEDDEGRACIHYLTKEGFLDLIQKLLQTPNVDINHQDRGGSTPLHYATEKGNLELVRFFFSCDGIDINIRNWVNNTPLDMAIIKKNVPMMDLYFTERNIKATQNYGISKHSFTYSTSKGDEDIIRYLLDQENGCDINYKDPNRDNNSALHIAVEQSNLLIVTHLLSYEFIDVNLKNKEGNTPLHIACKIGHENQDKPETSAIVSKIFKVIDLDVEITNNLGQTAQDLSETSFKKHFSSYHKKSKKKKKGKKK